MRKFQRRRFSRPERYRSHSYLYPALFFWAAVITLTGAWLTFLSRPTDPFLGTLVAATISAASIVYSLSRAREGARSQFTLTLLAGRFSNAEYANNVRIFTEARRAGSIQPATTMAQLKAVAGMRDDKPPYHAVIPFLNFWEHVCTAYVDDHIDRQVFEESVQDLIFDAIRLFPGVIGDSRAEDHENMEHLCATWFALASDADRAKFVPNLGSPPRRLCDDDKWRWETHSGKKSGTDK